MITCQNPYRGIGEVYIHVNHASNGANRSTRIKSTTKLHLDCFQHIFAANATFAWLPPIRTQCCSDLPRSGGLRSMREKPLNAH